jgi:hypothetical protein
MDPGREPQAPVTAETRTLVGAVEDVSTLGETGRSTRLGRRVGARLLIASHRGQQPRFGRGYSDARLRGGSQQSVSAGPGDGLLPCGDIQLVEHRGNVILDGAG